MRGSALLVSKATTTARRTARLSALVAVAAGLALAPTTGAAASAAAIPATGIKLPVSSAGAMIDVNGQLWVSDPSSNKVDIFSPTGTLLHQIGGLPGARGLLATTDGSTVEVAESEADAIAEVSTSTYTTTGTWATDACPWSLAWVSGLLAYSFGCDQGDWNSGVATLASPESTPSEMLDRQYSAPKLAGSGTTLAVSQLGQDPGGVITYTVAGDGGATQLASIAPPEGANVAFSPSGSSLLVASYGQTGTVAYDPTSGEHLIGYPGAGSTTATAVSPDGRYVATGFSNYDATINLVDTTTDSAVWTRLMTVPPNDGTTYAGMLADTLTFSANSSEVFGLASFQGVSGVYLFASDLHPTASHLSVKVSKVAAGRKLPVTLTGSAGARVALTATQSGLTPRSVGTVTLPASGRATLTFSSKYSGTLTASFPGNAAQLPSSTHAAYSVASKSKAHPLGGKTRHHVTYYTKLRQVRIKLTTTPGADAAWSGTPQARVHGRWVSGHTVRAHEVDGRGGVYFKKMSKNVKYRVKFTVSKSAFSRGSHVTSAEFELL
jgi:WD40 repeat protein